MAPFDAVKYQPLLKAACQAFLEDASYAISIAQAGASLASAGKSRDEPVSSAPSGV